MLLHHRFLQDMRSQQGSVFVFVAIAALMLIAATGAAVDMARAQVLQARMQSALDAAGLAAGATANTIDVQTQAQKYFNANFPTGYLGSGTVTVTATINSDSSIVTLSANTTQATTFMQAIGINSVTVAANTQVTRANEGIELALVLDNTGSMTAAVNGQAVSSTNPSKMLALKCAVGGEGAAGNNGTCAANGLVTQGLLDILMGSNNTVPNVWIGVVPFTQAANIGTGYSSWMSSTADAGMDFGPSITTSGSTHTCQSYTGTSPSTSGTYSSGPKCAYAISSTTNSSPPATNFGMTNWSGCVMARSASATGASGLTYNVSDDAPSSSTAATLFQAYNYGPTPTGYGSDRNATNYNPWYTSTTSSSGGRSSTTYTTTTTYNYSTSSGLGVSMGPNVLCPQPITPMVAEKSTVDNAVYSMVAGGDTNLDIGMAWGWRLLSPSWQGLWGGEMNSTGNTQFPELPLPYNTALMNKVVVFMTDGMNRFVDGDYSAYGFLDDNKLGTTNELSAEQDLDANTLAACNAMKAKGIIIYTIGFGSASPDNPPTESERGNALLVDTQLLQSCATQNYPGDTSHYFLAPTNAQLAAAFQQIAGELANLRVSQ